MLTFLRIYLLVIRTWHTRAQLAHLVFTMDWFLMTYGSAAAGVIYATILRQQDEGLTPPLRSTAYHIEQLQVFLQALSSVQITDPWYQSCKKAFSLFSRVNDELLARSNIQQSYEDSTVVGSELSHTTTRELSYTNELLTGLESNVMLPWIDYVRDGFEDQFEY